MTSRIDVGRIIRLATLLAACAAGVLVYLARTPELEAATTELASTESMLRSAEVAIAEVPAMRRSREALAVRYRGRLTQDGEAVFLRELGAVAARDRVTVVRTSAQDGPAVSGEPQGGAFVATPLVVELSGGYRSLLAAIASLSSGEAIVRVDPPSLKREQGAVDATIPVTVFEPSAGAEGAGR